MGSGGGGGEVAATPGGADPSGAQKTSEASKVQSGTSQRADHCGQGRDHKLITCHKGGHEAVKERILRKANPTARRSPSTIHSTPTDMRHVYGRDSCFQPSLGLCSQGSLFSDVLRPLHVCVLPTPPPHLAHLPRPILCVSFVSLLVF